RSPHGWARREAPHPSRASRTPILIDGPAPAARRALAFRQQPLEIEKTVECESGFPGLTSGDLGFEECLEVGKRAVELLRDAHQRAGFLDTIDWLFQNVNL